MVRQFKIVGKEKVEAALSWVLTRIPTTRPNRAGSLSRAIIMAWAEKLDGAIEPRHEICKYIKDLCRDRIPYVKDRTIELALRNTPYSNKTQSANGQKGGFARANTRREQSKEKSAAIIAATPRSGCVFTTHSGEVVSNFVGPYPATTPYNHTSGVPTYTLGKALFSELREAFELSGVFSVSLVSDHSGNLARAAPMPVISSGQCSVA